MSTNEGKDELWDALDVEHKGWLDSKDLEVGLLRLGHPLQSAGPLLREVFEAMDSDHDGRISKDHFRTFEQNADSKLRELFRSLPKNVDGKVAQKDLRNALNHSGARLTDPKLEEFFKKVDIHHQGAISSQEWRDFFLFSPTPISSLNDSLSYYSCVLKTSHDGDVYVSEEAYKHTGYFAAGGIASITSRTLTAPLDRLKIYLIAQTSSRNTFRLSNPSSLLNAVSPIKDACVSLWKAGGLYSLWAGNGLNIIKMLPEGAIKFGTYEASKRFFAKLQGVSDPTQISGWAQFASGGLGGIAAQFAAYPIDTLRFRMQCELVKGGVHGKQLISQTAWKMWKTGGLRPYYRGVVWGLVGQFPYSAIDLTTFEYTKQWFIRRNEARSLKGKDARPGAVATAAIGGFSGALGASVVWPLNMLRTRLQTQGTVVHPQTYTGIVDVTRKTIQNEGVRGLFRGISPNLIKVIPAVSITYVVYDQSKQAFGLD